MSKFKVFVFCESTFSPLSNHPLSTIYLPIYYVWWKRKEIEIPRIWVCLGIIFLSKLYIMFSEREKNWNFMDMGLSWNYICIHFIVFNERERDWNSMLLIISWNYIFCPIYFILWVSEIERDWNNMHLGLSWNFICVHSIMFSEKEILKSYVNSLRGLFHFVCVCNERQSFYAFLTSFKTIGFLIQNCEHVCLFVVVHKVVACLDSNYCIHSFFGTYVLTMAPLKKSTNFKFHFFVFSFGIGTLGSTSGNQHNQHLSFVPFGARPSSSTNAFFFLSLWMQLMYTWMTSHFKTLFRFQPRRKRGRLDRTWKFL